MSRSSPEVWAGEKSTAGAGTRCRPSNAETARLRASKSCVHRARRAGWSLQRVGSAAVSDPIVQTWDDLLAIEVGKPYWADLEACLADERARYEVLPAEDEVFAALEDTPFDRVKGVILGQDRYPTPGHAHGLAVSVRRGQDPALLGQHPRGARPLTRRAAAEPRQPGALVTSRSASDQHHPDGACRRR